MLEMMCTCIQLSVNCVFMCAYVPMLTREFLSVSRGTSGHIPCLTCRVASWGGCISHEGFTINAPPSGRAASSCRKPCTPVIPPDWSPCALDASCQLFSSSWFVLGSWPRKDRGPAVAQVAVGALGLGACPRVWFQRPMHLMCV